MSPRSMSTATAPVAGSAEAMTIARAAAEELTRLLPSTVPLTVASFDRSKLSGFRVADIDVADVARIVSHLELSEPVTLGNDGAQPR